MKDFINKAVLDSACFSFSEYQRWEVICASLAIGFFSSYFVYRMRYKRFRDRDSQTAKIAILDLTTLKDGSLEERRKQCIEAASSLHSTGVLYVKTPHVENTDNERFLDMMERYFEQSDGIQDARKQYNYQVGVTPNGVEKAKSHCDAVKKLNPKDKPFSECPPEADPKWRFFWRIGSRPQSTDFPSLNMKDVVPANFPEWEETMNMWGNKMLETLMKVAEAVAEGFGQPPNIFTSRMQNGPHLLAPTGTDLNTYNSVHTSLAAYHYDLNFLTIHGQSRFPGLHIWLRNGTRVMVKVPQGCLLVQAGKQMEYLTGGLVMAGFHEVVIVPETIKVIEKRKKEGKSLWRISSTLFGHIQSDQILKPLPYFETLENKKKFPPVKAGLQVLQELDAIKLGDGYQLNGKGRLEK